MRLLSTHRSRIVALVVAVSLCAAACDGDGGHHATLLHRPFTAAELAYGLAPQRDDHVKYQRDVVIVDGGPNIIRSVSNDGLTWTIDAHAKHANELKVGKIMFVTGNSVGQVVDMHRAGDNLAVTIVPVQINEILRDAKLHLDQPVDFGKAIIQRTPVLASLARSVADAAAHLDRTSTITLPTIQLMSVSKPPPVIPDGQIGGKVTFRSGDNFVTIAVSKTALTFIYLRAVKGRNLPSSGLKLGVQLQIRLNNPRVEGDLEASDGRIVGGGVKLKGVSGIAVSVAGGTSTGPSSNAKVRLEIPYDLKFLTQQFELYGVPVVVSLKPKFIITTAFSMKNSNMTASGDYALAGDIGVEWFFANPVIIRPKFSVRKALLNSLESFSLSADGLVLAFELKVVVGVGVRELYGGLFTKFLFSYGLTTGSTISFGGLLGLQTDTKCRKVEFNLDITWGATIAFDAGQVAYLNALMQRLKIKRTEIDAPASTWNVIKKKGQLPNSYVCSLQRK